MTRPILAGAEPFSAAGGPHGVLVLHGYTGTPGSLRALAAAIAAGGATVELPLLPGHGTAPEDLMATRWADWAAAAEAAYGDLAQRCRKVALAGLSMGGTLAAWLAARHPEAAGLVLVNPLIDPPAQSFREVLRGMLATGATDVPAIGSDIADPDAHELSYDVTPIEPLLSLFDATDGLLNSLADIGCPVLLFTSRNDHVVPPVSSDIVADRVSGPVERVFLDRSFHVATQDYDRAQIETRTSEFLAKVFAA